MGLSSWNLESEEGVRDRDNPIPIFLFILLFGYFKIPLRKDLVLDGRWLRRGLGLSKGTIDHLGEMAMAAKIQTDETDHSHMALAPCLLLKPDSCVC